MEGYKGYEEKRRNTKNGCLAVCLDEVEDVHNGREAPSYTPEPIHDVLSVFLLHARMRFMQILN